MPVLHKASIKCVTSAVLVILLVKLDIIMMEKINEFRYQLYSVINFLLPKVSSAFQNLFF